MYALIGIIETGKRRVLIRSNDELAERLRMDRTRFYRLKKEGWTKLRMDEFAQMSKILNLSDEEIGMAVRDMERNKKGK